jgi:hypothetical protein
MEEGKKREPLTREDVLRLIEEHGGKAEGLDLSDKVFEKEIDLREIDLYGIILKGAELVGAHLEGAELVGAHLEEADLGKAHLEGADLVVAHLKGAFLWEAHLEGADLVLADLDGANLSGAHLEGARLSGAIFSRDTELEGADWGSKYILAEEVVKGFELATGVYRTLKQWYTNAGMYDRAGKFYYREMEAKRKGRSWREEPHLKLWSWVMRLLCGYGEKPERLVGWGGLVIFGLAGFYTWLGSFASKTFLNCLYYSGASFTALGYGSWAPQPSGWPKAMGAVEAVIGVFMMALFLVTFTRKMTR